MSKTTLRFASRPTPQLLLAVSAFLLFSAGASSAASDRKVPEPRFPRDEAARADARKAADTRPPAPEAPAGLAPVRPAASRRASVERDPAGDSDPSDRSASGHGQGGRSGDAQRTRPDAPPRPAPPDDPSDPEIERRGLDAGARMADSLAATDGRREAYRVGLWRGQRVALNDHSLGRRDREAGRSAGRWDPEARRFGADEGAAAAARLAERDAPRQVERQFKDLDRRPVASPLPPRIDFRPDFAPSPVPTLDAVFVDYPLARVPGSPRRLHEATTGWSWWPSRVRGCDDWNEFADRGWQDPDRAFRIWAADSRRAAYYRSLRSRHARAWFEAAFADGFLDRLDALRRTVLDRAFDEGFADGWDYGAFIVAEWSFRQGYVEGFDEGMALAAQISFERSYPIEYAAAYDAEFRDWMTSARPAIVSWRLADGNDDGIFEPGEALTATAELANYGGAPATFTASLEGGPLDRPAESSVRLAARSRSTEPAELEARIDRAAAAPSNATLTLTLGAERSSLPLLVSYPMEFTRTISYDSRPLEGRARVSFEVVNLSRRAVADVAVLRDTGRAADGDRVTFATVEPGRARAAEFALDGIRPLDLIAGTLEVPVTLTAGGRVQGRRTARFPGLATRLDDPSLVEYLVALGGERDPSLADVDETRRLLMQRLRADWIARCEEAGNAYQRDERNGTGETALGELVRAYQRDRNVLSRSIAFHGLDEEIVRLADTLPGVHPNLRRSVKKLAAKLDG